MPRKPKYSSVKDLIAIVAKLPWWGGLIVAVLSIVFGAAQVRRVAWESGGTGHRCQYAAEPSGVDDDRHLCLPCAVHRPGLLLVGRGHLRLESARAVETGDDRRKLGCVEPRHHELGPVRVLGGRRR